MIIAKKHHLESNLYKAVSNLLKSWTKMAINETGTVSDMTPSDLVIKFLLENKIQRGVVDDMLERGFDSLEALSLLDPEDVKSQKIPVGQRRLLLHIAKSLGTNGAPNPQTGTGTQSANVTTSTENQQSEDSMNDIYHQTLVNSLVDQRTRLAGNQTDTQRSVLFSLNSDNGNLNSSVQSDAAQPSWRDPQIHIATATGKLSSIHYDIVDFVPHSVEEELVIGGQGEQQVVVKSEPKKPKLENLSLSQWLIANMAI